MHTSALKSFAPKARASLIADVDARVAAVLTLTSTERVESPTAVARLEHAVKDAGGGAEGRAAVAERVAYTWFNRIVALRFMDANGYTGVGVVSPPAGQTAGQPEILSQARAGVIDTEVVSSATAARVTALLDGTRRSTDPQGEAYAALLEAYCRKWADTMKDIFGSGGDETELLIPAGLLADTSVRALAVEILTKEACQDAEVIGWLYQFYISERKDDVFAGFKKNIKAGPAEIPAATQLFTPNWIVRYLVENSLGRLWLLNHPQSGLRGQMEYYIDPVDEVTDFLKIISPEEIKVVDPACGSGHMLTYAFDLLYAIYEEEGYAPSEIPSLILTHNLFGIEIDPRAEALASLALTMKARAKDRRFFARSTKPNVRVLTPIRFTPDELDLLRPSTIGRAKWASGSETVDLFEPSRQEIDAFWNQFEHADTFGSLIQPDAALIEPLRHHIEAIGDDTLGAGELHADARMVLDQAEYLTQRYHVAVANPPYMDARNMGADLSDYVTEMYPVGDTGLDLAFAVRMERMVQRAGLVGLLNMDSWLGNAECGAFRDHARARFVPRLVLQLGPRAFPEIAGEVVQVSASLFQCAASDQESSVFIRATNGATADAKIAQFRDVSQRFSRRLDWFDAFPGRVFSAYAASEHAHATFATAPLMNTVAEVRTGLQTGDNARFLRYWFEVSHTSVHSGDLSSAARWVPYVKSSSPTRWFAREDYVVNWASNGAEIRQHQSAVVRNSSYYFRPGLSYGGLAGALKARIVAPGAIFDQKNSMVFPAGEVGLWQLLALMNSPAFEHLARLISQKGFGVGTLAKLPIPKGALKSSRIEAIASRAVDLTSRVHDRAEESRGFHGLPSVFLGFPEPDLRVSVRAALEKASEIAAELTALETENAEYFASSLIAGSPTGAPASSRVSDGLSTTTLAQDLVSFAVGCMFGRFSLDVPGLVLADQGNTLAQYRAKLAEAGTAVGRFQPDDDGVLPIVDSEWFADDIVTRFLEFLRIAFGDEHRAENVRFVEQSLGVKTLREYFITKTGKSKFYDDHVKRYKRRPIYWMFSSPKGSFNALVYLHRYTPSTVGTVLNEYLREYQAKLVTAITHEERVAVSSSSPRDAARAAKEAERLRKVVTELDTYEHDMLYPLAARQVALDLDDGVKANYPKLGAALRKIAGLEASDG